MGNAYPTPMPDRGFSSPYEWRRDYRPLSIPRPANDNWPSLPKPANDNVPGGGRGGGGGTRVPPTPPRLPAKTRKLYRTLPWLRLAELLIEMPTWSMDPGQPPSWKLNGWTKVAECAFPLPPISADRGRLNGYGDPSRSPIPGYASACTGGQASVTDWYSPIPSDATSIGYLVHTHYFGNPGYWTRRFQVQVAFTRPGTGPAIAPEYLPALQPQPQFHPAPVVPTYIPALAPEAIPIGKPVPEPAPLPWRAIPLRVPNPLRSPVEQTQRGYQLPPRPELPTRDPAPIVITGPKPWPDPGHEWAPPRVRTKERKMNIYMSPGSVPARLIGWGTEALDALGALYDALLSSPLMVEKYGKAALERMRRNDATPQEKAARIYYNFERMDLTQAVKNLITNEVQDRIIGAIGRRTAKANQDFGRPAGFALGPAL